MEHVLVVRKGGLGNQMFQVAAGLVYGKRTGKQVVLPREMKHTHNSQNQDYADTVFRSIPLRLNVVLDAPVLEFMKRQGMTLYPGEPGFEPWAPLNTAGPVILHGYFQYYPPIAAEEEWIRSWFLQNLDPVFRGLPVLTTAHPSDRIGIHVRRGDFLKAADVHPPCPLSYYAASLQWIQGQAAGPKTFVLFSDDVAWCKQQSVFQTLDHIVFCEEQDEVKALCNMIQCQGGFVCANSTFSWWGAFLGAFSKRSPVCVPHEKDWIRMPIHSLFPPEWHRVAAA